MHFHLAVASLFSLAVIPGAFAVPSGPPTGSYPSWKNCLTPQDAQQISENFFTITGGKGIFNRTVAEATLADDFSDSSESVASIVDDAGTGPIALLRPTFSNKTSFINANAEQPETKYEALNLYHTCDVVIQRFQVTNLKPQPPRGISIFETVPAPKGNLYPFQIKQVYGEIDAAAWLVDIGDIKPGGCKKD